MMGDVIAERLFEILRGDENVAPEIDHLGELPD